MKSWMITCVYKMGVILIINASKMKSSHRIIMDCEIMCRKMMFLAATIRKNRM
jgi:hypothetical protein